MNALTEGLKATREVTNHSIVGSRSVSEAAAAWVQAIGTILAIGVAIWVPYRQRKYEQEDRAAHHRKVVMSAAATLEVALRYQGAVLDFAPHPIDRALTLEQAREQLKLRTQTREALQAALNKSHYFSEKLCESIVKLAIEAAAYERVIDDAARHDPNQDAETFFKSASDRTSRLAARIREVRKLLSIELPEAVRE